MANDRFNFSLSFFLYLGVGCHDVEEKVHDYRDLAERQDASWLRRIMHDLRFVIQLSVNEH